MSFTHLEVHSHFTLLGATPSVLELAARAAADGISHLALTDTNALYGAIAFARACHASGIQPIIGMTVKVALPEADARQSGQLVLLATGPEGYRSLCRLSSLIQSSRDREAATARGLDWDSLRTHRNGLICLSGGRLGWVERYLRLGDVDAAQQYAGKLAETFDSSAYLALEIHVPEDEQIAVPRPSAVRDVSISRDLGAETQRIAARLGIGTVAVQPIYCLAPEDKTRLRLLAAIRLNCRIEAVPADELPDGGDPRITTHWPSPDDMRSRFARYPDALSATAEIAARCGTALPGGKAVWPVPVLPADQTPASALASQALAGLSERYLPEPSPEAEERLRAELDVIVRQGYAPLLLVVADIVRFARSSNIPVSTRGSVANSLVAYCVGITTVDPILHGLLFERFLSPARADPPDIDLDLCSRRRDEVLDYVRRTYGVDHMALIGTHSTMRIQSAVRETGKAYGLPDSEVAKIATVLPRGWHPDPRRRDERSMEDVVGALSDPRQQEIVRLAYALVGQPDHLSVHAGGLVITPDPLTDTLPLQWSPKGFLITQYEHGDVEALGLPKIDLLGIRALTVLADAAELVRKHWDPSFRLEDIRLDDPLTGDLLERGETIGVFQCESDGAQRTLRKLRARGVVDLAIANAFFKPGPSTGGMARAFVRRYRGEEPVTYLHPSLASILGPTKGVLIFQEQILRISREIASLDWAQADHLRRGMSKFRPDEMERLREQFIAGCQRPEPDGPAFSPGQAEMLWEQVAAFAGYGFNQGHATAYADVSYRSAYLKAHWPAAFLCARLADWGGFHHPAVYMAEAVRLGIPVRPPHVNFSGEHFTLQAGKPAHPVLWMGLGAVRDLRQSAIEAIITESQTRPFTSVRDLVMRVRLQTKELTHLIQCGALDGLGDSRTGLLAQAEALGKAGSASQLAFSFAQPQPQREMPAQRLEWERRILGQPVSVHPLELIASQLPANLPLRSLPEHAGQVVTVAGVRLPGWTGGPGYFLGDGDWFLIARGDERPRPWQPVLLHGRWQRDTYGSSWFQAQETTSLS